MRFLSIFAAAVSAASLAPGLSLADTAPAAAQPKPAASGSYVEKIPGTALEFQMVACPGGKLVVKDTSGKTLRTVTVRPLFTEKTETTWQQFDAMGFSEIKGGAEAGGAADAAAKPSKPYGAPDRGFGHHGYPVISVSYDSAKAYCVWLSAQTGKKYRLPTEDEWEYLCLANKPAPAGDKLKEVAWFFQMGTQPVGKKAANAFGLHDMLGNAAEWCTGVDGKPVLRGGNYSDMPKQVTPSARAVYNPDWQMSDPQSPKSRWWLSDCTFSGFRVVRDQ